MAEAGRCDIYVECGADVELNLTLYDGDRNPIDLTNATVIAQLREFPESKDALNFTCTHNGSGAEVQLKLSHEQTNHIGYSAGVYDVFVIYSDDTVEKIMYGDAQIIHAVTHLA